MVQEGNVLRPAMNLRRLLLITILAPSVFVIGVVLFSYLPHRAGLLTHGGEHVFLGLVMVTGIIPFSFFTHHIFRRIQGHILQQNEELARRTGEMEALLRVARAAEESLELDQVLRSASEAVLDATSGEAVEVWLVEEPERDLVLRHHQGEAREAFLEINRFPLGEGYPGIVAATGQPILVHDLPSDTRFLRKKVNEAGFLSFCALPLRRSGKVTGVLAVASRDANALTSEDELRLLELMADHIAVAVENARLHQEVRTLATLTERERIAMEMHDGLGQVLGYVNTKAQAVKELLRAGQVENAAVQMEQLETAAQDTYEDVREAILALGTNSRGHSLLEGLQEYVRRFQEFSGLSVELVVTGTPFPFNAGAEVQLLRIVQEALANVRKHAEATKTVVNLSFQSDGCRFLIEDNGHGFDPEQPTQGPWPHLGLQSMRARATAIGARFELSSEPGKGTKVTVDVPRFA